MDLIEHARWIRDNMENTARYNFPNLDSTSLVIDAGGYKGEWAQRIYNIYNCNIRIYEPVLNYATNIHQKFAANDKVSVYAYGLGGSTRKEMISTNGDSASIFGEANEEIEICDVFDEFYQNSIKKIDLMKINIEGAEYELLNRLIETGMIENIDVLQIQFHDFVEGAELKRNLIIDELRKTHECSWCYNFVWEEWIKR